MDVLLAQAVLRAVFHVATAGVEHEDAFACGSAGLVDDDDAGGYAGAEKEVGRQADDALDVAALDQLAANLGLGVAAKEHAVRQDAGARAGAFERADDVQQVGVVALLGRRHAEGLKTVEGVVQRVEAGAPALVRKGWIGNNVIEGLECRAVAEFWIGERVALQD